MATIKQIDGRSVRGHLRRLPSVYALFANNTKRFIKSNQAKSLLTCALLSKSLLKIALMPALLALVLCRHHIALPSRLFADVSNFIDVRFKNQGLDSIEIQDNGSGILPANYESVALKHHTSKLSTYSDIASLDTFGFRGEALASLCALSTVTITTCLSQDVPKGTKLTFEPSGHLKSTSIVAAQRGTTVAVDALFHNLPVRRRELERNIKREWHKVIALLNQYACILTQLKFSVSQQPTKGKRILLFSTKGNISTKDNIINIFGAKTMAALVSLDLKLEIQPTTSGINLTSTDTDESKEVRVLGHVSRPVHGEGRQTPDRQMFFVNGRPCGLPQFAKTFNEVYKSYNYSQSPFIFADIRLDTNMYDVNVSPDKRSILLHDQNNLLDSLRAALVELFDHHEYTIPVAQAFSTLGRSATNPSTAAKQLQATSDTSDSSLIGLKGTEESEASEPSVAEDRSESSVDEPVTIPSTKTPDTSTRNKNTGAQSLISRWASGSTSSPAAKIHVGSRQTSISARFGRNSGEISQSGRAIRVRDFNDRLAEQMPNAECASVLSSQESEQEEVDGVFKEVIPEPQIPATQPMRLADDTPRMRNPRSLKRDVVETISVTIGDISRSKTVFSPSKRRRTESIATDDASVEAVELSDNEDVREERQEEGSEPNLEIEDSESEQDGSEPDQGLDVEPRRPDLEEEEEADSSEQDRTPSNDGMEMEGGEVASDQEMAGDNETRCGRQPSDKQPTATDLKRINIFQPASRRKDATLAYVQCLDLSTELLGAHAESYKANASRILSTNANIEAVEDISAVDAESRLQLIISKGDFGKMRVIGQFNMGFIIAVRPGNSPIATAGNGANNDELFIIDQHASDEKYNFERLQSSTVVQSQRLVHPKTLNLTALEEEIVMENLPTIETNGFKLLVDTSGDSPVGSRCVLTALPLSRETAFSLEDLEELIAILAEAPGGSGSSTDSVPYIARPSKVRKMFAMRACRSSVMIGKALTMSQMYGLVRHMGELDKPWNCPHGRPTMRHLCRLQAWDEQGWKGDLELASAARWKAFARGDE